MAQVIVTFKIMPEDPDTSLDGLKGKIELEIKQFGGQIGKVDKVPVGFGLSSLNIVFIYDESIGGTDVLEEKISAISGIQSCEVIDCRRALG